MLSQLQNFAELAEKIDLSQGQKKNEKNPGQVQSFIKDIQIDLAYKIRI